MQLTETQMFILGLVATTLVAGINFYIQKRGKKVHRAVLTSIVFVVSVALAWLWNPPALPAIPANGEDPALFAVALLGFAGELVTSATAVLGAATLIYNLLLKQIFERLATQLFIPK